VNNILENDFHILFPLDATQWQADYWLAKLSQPHKRYLSADAIHEHNMRMLAYESSLLDINQVPVSLPKAAVLNRLMKVCQRPDKPFYAENGVKLDESTWHELIDNCALNNLPEIIEPRYALAVRRADLRRFPSSTPVYSSLTEHDIDRFQESALFPSNAVVVLHQSRDQAWHYVGSQHYHAWIAKEAIALGSREQVLAYKQRQHARVMTGSVVHTAYTPQYPALSQLQLDMGLRIPLCTDWPLDQPVNGQLAAASWILEMPQNDRDGSLKFAPVLLPYSADSCADYLPLTPANIIHQAFKFLGERYGWGHRFNTRDCSGLICEIYRSFNIVLPRNSGDQAHNLLLDTVNLPPPNERSTRLAALQQLQVGDLIYIPGHVMLVIGHDQDMTWVIHDTATSGYIHATGQFMRALVNGVVITPLERLYLDLNTPYIDRIISIKRVSRHIQ